MANLATPTMLSYGPASPKLLPSANGSRLRIFSSIHSAEADETANATTTARSRAIGLLHRSDKSDERVIRGKAARSKRKDREQTALSDQPESLADFRWRIVSCP